VVTHLRDHLILLSALLCAVAPSSCTSADKGVERRAPPDSASLPAEFVNTVGMKFRWIAPGRFLMGSPATEAAPPAFKKIEAQHAVTIPRGFYLGETEVTNSQMHTFVSDTGYERGKQEQSDFLRHLRDKSYSEFAGPEQPVIFVSWNDAMAFCRWLSKRENRRYRLPTEKEWEYACRCGTECTYGCASDTEALMEYAWLAPNSEGHTHPVATRLPNAWGLYDMNGNVWEWTQTMMAAALLRDTRFAGQRVAHFRGGSYLNQASSARCAARWAGWPLDTRASPVGFRVVLDEFEQDHATGRRAGF
jgi:formylglycine-generating enzyme required for sulfatase activity